jgi:uncharacterized repeat protein (TIGR01451 family)
LQGTAPRSVTLGNNVTYTLTVTNDGTAGATGVTLTDTLPAGVNLVSATGGATPVNGVLTFNIGNLAAGASFPTVTIVVTPKTTGTLNDSATVSSTSPDSNPNNNSFSLATLVNPSVVAGDGPTVQSLRRFGVHLQPTVVVLTFSEPLDPGRAQAVSNYRIVGPGGRRIRVSSAVYDAAMHAVIIRPAQRLNVHYSYRLTVVGTGPTGLTDTSGRLLDGTRTGSPGSNYRATVDWRVVVLGDPHPLGSALHRAALRHRIR